MTWFERQRYFIDFTLSSLLRRKWKNFALVLVYTLLVFLIGSVMLFSEAVRRQATDLLADAPDVLVQRMIAGRHDLIPASYAEQILGIRGVHSVTERLWGYYYHPGSKGNYTLTTSDHFEHGDEAVIVGDGVIRTWKPVEKNVFYFMAYDGELVPMRVVGAFSPSTDIVTTDLILMSKAAFRRIFGVPDGYLTDIGVQVRNRNECPTIAEKITKILPDTRPILREEILRTYGSLFDWRSGYIIVLLTGAVLAFFIFAWEKATGLSAEEKLEVGILKALGWDTADILIMKFWEGAVISLSAFIMGIFCAYIHVFLTSVPLFEHALKGWSVVFPEFKLYPSVDLYLFCVLFFLTVLPYTIITVVPTWKVAVTDPDSVMR